MDEPTRRTRERAVQIRLTDDEYALLERRTPPGLMPGPYARSLLLAALISDRLQDMGEQSS